MTLFGVEGSVAMAPEEFVVRGLGRMLEAGAAGCATGGGIPVHYLQLPQAAWTCLRDVLGVDGSDATLQALQSAARWDAKNPHFEFVDDSARKQREAAAQIRELAQRWAMPAYLELEALRMSAETSAPDPARAPHSVAPTP